LYVANEILGLRLNTIHNLHYYAALMQGARQAIQAGTFAAWRQETLARMQPGPSPEPVTEESQADG
jgi:queuine tRNA-ribosyltransferase